MPIFNPTKQSKDQVDEIAVVSAAEEVLPITTHDADKGGITTVEDILDEKPHDLEDPNSPWSILQRYPLLRSMSPGELDTLNRRVRRRM